MKGLLLLQRHIHVWGFICLAMFLPCLAIAQPPAVEWQVVLAGSKVSNGHDVLQLSDGGYLVTGTSSASNGNFPVNYGNVDIWAVRFDSLGNVDWARNYGGSGVDGEPRVVLTPDGGFMFAAITTSMDSDITNYYQLGDVWVVKLSAQGDIEWQRVYGGMGSEQKADIVLTPDGGVAVFATTFSNDGDLAGVPGLGNMWLFKLDAVGNIQWQRRYGGSQPDFARSIKLTSEGGYIISGFSSSSDGDITHNSGDQDWWMAGLDSLGVLQWQQSLGSPGREQCADMALTSDSGIVIVGVTTDSLPNVWPYFGQNGDALIAKFSQSGSFLWAKNLGSNIFESAWSVTETRDCGLAVAFMEDVNGILDKEIGLIKFDRNGSTEWRLTLPNPGADMVSRVIETSDGGYIITGSIDTAIATTVSAFGLWVIKLDGIDTNIDLLGISDTVFCPGDNLEAMFSASGKISCYNIYTLQLSDAFGEFDSPINLASINGAEGQYTLNATIPLNLPASNFYKLRVVSELPVSVSDSFSIGIYETPTASFTTSASCANTPVQFINTSSIGSGSIVSFQYNFGDGGMSATSNPTHAYLGLGSYIASLTVTSNAGCVDSFSKSIQVELPDTSIVNQTICFGDTYLGYSSSGTYIHTIAASVGCDSVVQLLLNVLPAPEVNQSLEICKGDSVFLQGGYQSAAGNYIDTLFSLNNCDTIVHTDLTISTVNGIPQISQNGSVLSVDDTYTYYSWYCNGVLVSVDTAAITAVGSGYYYVWVTDDNKCHIASDSIYVQVLHVDGFISNRLWQAYPNPTNGQLFVSTRLGEPYQVSVVNNLGQVVKQIDVPNGEDVTIHLTELPKGIYHLRLKGSSTTQVKSIVFY